ncbi:MAG: hypothetical protein ACKPB3_04675 [Bacteroidota bacterium]
MTTKTPNFIIAAGGTGMRCLQSFLNVCALGMYTGETIDILLLETDIENGDKKNSENLVNWYNTLQTGKAGKHEYFGPNINFHVFVPDYSQDNKRRFTLISRTEEGDNETNRMLVDLFYEEGVQEFDLMHGFRAQTHVGTYLMYHAIVEEIREAVEKDIVRNKSHLYKFINKIKDCNNSGEARVFVLGSTFGGTGASSIPVMARAITDAAKIITGGMINMENIFFGAVILTPYFKFKSPSKEHKKAEKVIADSQFFAHNSAAALMYYIKDNTILQTYKRFYMLGWPFGSLDMDQYKERLAGGKASGKTITGGKSQENPAHPNELMAAFAAQDFLMDTEKDWFRETYTTEVKFKAIEYEPNEKSEKVAYFGFDDFITDKKAIAKAVNADGSEAPKSKDSTANISRSEIFAKNFTGMYYFSLLLQDTYGSDLKSFLANVSRYNYGYNLTTEEIEAFNRYAQYITYTKDDKSVKPGWIPQMFYSLQDPKKGEFLGYESTALDVLSMASATEESKFGKTSLFSELKSGGAKQADRFISAWCKQNKPIKGGKKEDFFADLRKTLSSFNVSYYFVKKD